MGGNSSDNRTLSDEIWQRDITNMFTSAKMTRIPTIEPDFLLSVEYEKDSKRCFSYIFITKEGMIYSVSQILPDIEFTTELDCECVIDCALLSEATFALICDNKKVFIVEYSSLGFQIKEVLQDNANKIIPVNNTQFLILGCDLSLCLCDTTGMSSLIWKPLGTFEILSYSLIKSSIFAVITNDSFFVGSALIPNSPIDMIDLHGFSSLVSTKSGATFLLSSDKKGIESVNISSGPIFSDRKKIAQLSNPIKKLVSYGQNTVLALMSSSIVAFTNDFKPRTVNFSGFDLYDVLYLRKHPFFVAFSSNGRIILCKLPESSKSDENPQILTTELSDLHKSRIIRTTTGEESSFITLDENKCLILWENLPNWWNAPHFFDMFGEKPGN